MALAASGKEISSCLLRGKVDPSSGKICGGDTTRWKPLFADHLLNGIHKAHCRIFYCGRLYPDIHNWQFIGFPCFSIVWLFKKELPFWGGARGFPGIP